jgi:hypothetical protein
LRAQLQAISNAPKLPAATEKRDIQLSEQKFSSNRQRALDFAKNVPKPKVRLLPVYIMHRTATSVLFGVINCGS